jgi:hypothetical protein
MTLLMFYPVLSLLSNSSIYKQKHKFKIDIFQIIKLKECKKIENFFIHT